MVNRNVERNKNMQGIAKRNAERKKEFNERGAKRTYQPITNQDNSMKLKENISTRLTKSIKKVHNYIFDDINRFQHFVVGAVLVLGLIGFVLNY